MSSTCTLHFTQPALKEPSTFHWITTEQHLPRIASHFFLSLSLSLYLDPPYSLTTWPIHIQLLVTPTNVVYSWKIRRHAGEYFIPRFHSKLGFKTCGSQTEKNFAASSVGWPRGRAWRAKQKLHLSVSTQFYEQCRQWNVREENSSG